jgi:hypothetical protein
VSCVAIAAPPNMHTRRKLRSICNCEERRTRRGRASARGRRRAGDPRGRSASGSRAARRAGSITSTHAAAIAPHRRPARRAAGRGRIGGYTAPDNHPESSVMPTFSNCVPGNCRVHLPWGVQTCHPTSRRRGRVAGPS